MSPFSEGFVTNFKETFKLIFVAQVIPSDTPSLSEGTAGKPPL